MIDHTHTSFIQPTPPVTTGTTILLHTLMSNYLPTQLILHINYIFYLTLAIFDQFLLRLMAKSLTLGLRFSDQLENPDLKVISRCSQLKSAIHCPSLARHRLSRRLPSAVPPLGSNCLVHRWVYRWQLSWPTIPPAPVTLLPSMCVTLFE